ncbi:TPA: hypothetical protein JBL19_04160 [Legionella pneumophila]|nr:hypothetical protein [Legionella pneumophila]MDW8880638.1 hypothetical protein [Legionella pneumophila subsp. fraseri]MDW8962254.1 hypothetical protein [Legionella pneumophila subsp. fraseri]MDW9034752.1 hypothetical protein [Legionella pneumophila subsp. fraseri]MDW9037572.1 hypothetical protein [Legionella pneumophila subsp. fraseri]MDW9040873.1 hypothetical protein [Legionella pneumophila subsp. fraseri]
MINTEERPLLRSAAGELIKKLCEGDYKRFYGLRTDLRELIKLMTEIHHEIVLKNQGGCQ